MKPNFSFAVVRIVIAVVHAFLTVQFKGMSKVMGTLSIFVICFGRIFCSSILFLQ